MRRSTFKDGVQYNTRHIMNDKEVTLILREYDFEPVDVTQIPFEQQTLLFYGAEAVVAPLGASLSNMIFAKPNTVVIGLGAYYENADYSYFSNMMAALGHDLHFVLGSQLKEYDKHAMHRNYYICTRSLRAALQKIFGY